jgi:hypothetical protein
MPSPINFDFAELRDDSLREIGAVLVEQAKDNMDDYSHGRTYMVNGRVHIVSRVGQTANNLSGDLNDSIRYKLSNGVMEFGAGNRDIDYAGYLEENHTRPNYMKSVNQNRSEIRRIVGNRIELSITQGSNWRRT